MEQAPSITTTTTSSSSTAATGQISAIAQQQEEQSAYGVGGISAGGGSSESQRSISIAPSATPSPVLSPPGKLFGRNTNGTLVATSTPSNEAELQLYRVLQKASLLAYYDTLLEMGGDDVQQLCDAGEEEFLEIMALVGMASKPLHVRRLQKSLHEWATHPALFQNPLPTTCYSEPTTLLYTPEPSTSRAKFPTSPSFHPTPLQTSVIPTATATATTQSSVSGFSPLTTPQVTSSSPQLTPVLAEAQLSRIIIIAEKMVKQIPQKEPRPHSKKRTTRELEQVIAMSEHDPRRMDEIRKYSAIYGRFDCKRRPEKPLTLHEVCVNEAAAQLCKFIPALLTRRDELFPLARQLVKDAGFGHSASIARFGVAQQTTVPEDTSEQSTMKRVRLTSTDTSDYGKDYLDDTRINLLAMYQKLTKPPFDISDISKFSLSRSDYDEDIDNDSRYSFSTSGSPTLPIPSEIDSSSNNVQNNGRNELNESNDSINNSNHHNGNIGITSNSSPLGVQIISSASGQIIAVANPALIMSPLNDALNIKRERPSPEA